MFRIVLKIIVFCCMLAVFSLHAKTSSESKDRQVVIDSIILHTIGGPKCIADKVVFTGAKGSAKRWKRYFEAHKVLGIHYLIDSEGRLETSIAPSKVANHAIGWNQRSIGIELVNSGDGSELFPRVQMATLVELVKILRQRYRYITLERILRHSDIDASTFTCSAQQVRRKQDPGSAFDFLSFKGAVAE